MRLKPGERYVKVGETLRKDDVFTLGEERYKVFTGMHRCYIPNCYIRKVRRAARPKKAAKGKRGTK